ncbi:hypothetical protein TSUD_108730 [Trifolium subterraneum]|nr:hypothetical protein TSUD_108730 [Trifolium subterraneum]
MVSCAGCKQQHRRCGAQCPTRTFFNDQQEYRQVHDTFTSDHVRRWMAAARLNNNGARCAAALKWEGMARSNDPVGGSHGLYLQARAERQHANQLNEQLLHENGILLNMISGLMQQPPPPPQGPQQ